MTLSDHWEELPLLNRTAIRVWPTEKFKQWARDADRESEEDLSMEPDDTSTLYLISGDFASRDEVRKALTKHWKTIAAEQFSGWHTEPSEWPILKSIRDFEAFSHWDYSEMIFDLSLEPLEADEFAE